MTGPPQITNFDFHGLAVFVDRALLALEGLAWPWRALQDHVTSVLLFLGPVCRIFTGSTQDSRDFVFFSGFFYFTFTRLDLETNF